MHRWRSILLLVWTIAVLVPLAGNPSPLAADQSSAITSGGSRVARVKGRAIFTDTGGDEHTCRYGEAVLVPADSRSSGVVLSFFGGTTEGHIKESSYRDLVEQIGPSAIRTDRDQNGNFEFRDVKVGPYFILGRTLWFNRWARDGKVLMRSVELTGTTGKDVLLRYTENP